MLPDWFQFLFKVGSTIYTAERIDQRLYEVSWQNCSEATESVYYDECDIVSAFKEGHWTMIITPDMDSDFDMTAIL